MNSVTLKVEGMHCEGCAKTIEALLGVEPGITRATVSFKAGEAQVHFDPNAIDDGQIVAAIERAGYKVAVAGQ